MECRLPKSRCGRKGRIVWYIHDTEAARSWPPPDLAYDDGGFDDNLEVFMSAFEQFPRITPFLWFDSNAEDAVNFYISVFENSRRLTELRNGDNGPGPKGSILTIAFELDGQKFTALNGGPMFKFTEAVSFMVRCDSQEEVDRYWSKLSAGGNEIQCGWLKDKFGLSWQIVPARLPELIKNPKAMQAMLKMKKLDIAELERAAQS
jgi:predicted 3-demethylubiquinone-9 3-methyltransferase (glyoxalase superfamily)